MEILDFHFTSPEEIEAAFYTAFVQADSHTMEALWAKDEALCVHPGSHVIQGFDMVVRSWAHIFTDAATTDLKLRVIQRHRDGDIALHVLEEHISVRDSDVPAAIVIATNVYKKYDDGWLIVQHHASLVQSQHQGQTLQ